MPMNQRSISGRHHVVVVGGGFGGLYAVQALRDAPVDITLIDKRNFHLFQPLLYQVATGGLSPGDIASPLRAILKGQDNVSVIQAEVVDFEPDKQKVILRDGELHYDSLLLATGAANSYFSKDAWEQRAPGLKTLEDALDIRRKILLAFETAERETDPEKRNAWMTFVVIGGGPTGVELAGAIAELAHSTLEGEYENISPAESEIILLEGQPDILPAYPPLSSANARRSLERLGVCVQPGTMVEDIQEGRLVYRRSDGAEVEIYSHTILWAAGMQASSFTRTLQQRTGVDLDRSGRVIVKQDLSIPGWPNIFAIGDMTHFPGEDRAPLPGVAPVAMQQGRYIADVIQARLTGRGSAGFKYKDKGSLAVIGRNAAVAVFGRLQIAGFLAWVAWIFIHLWYIIEYDNKLMVLIQWAWNYFTRKRGARLITGSHPYPVVDKPQSQVDMVESSFQLDAIANHKSR